nr:MAG TPA: hypothetical protein [Caudoviricetes sp.]DAX43428.1 MAG TPA: hypothetical protein [Caudoviricetes sp.]DAY06068.1 MAG TPA: hypothetical protein [Caudoviricetes sp.]
MSFVFLKSVAKIKIILKHTLEYLTIHNKKCIILKMYSM